LGGHIGLEVLAAQLDRFDFARLANAARLGRLHRIPLTPRPIRDPWSSPLAARGSTDGMFSFYIKMVSFILRSRSRRINSFGPGRPDRSTAGVGQAQGSSL